MNIFPITQTALLAGQLMDTKVSTTPLIEMTSFKPEYDFNINSSRLERCTPEEEGISSLVLAELINSLVKDKSVCLHSITIARNGRVICEAAIGAQRLDVWKHSFSACKSVTSLAIGMLIDDGVLSLDERIIDIFKDETTPLTRIKLKDLCVEDLLTMRSTLTFAEGDSMTEEDWVRSFLASPTKGVVGETFRYNSLNTYMLSAIVTKKKSVTLSEFLKERLFEPLGISDYYWEKCPKGIDKGGWGLYIRPEDFLKIGQLIVNKGMYGDRRIISEEYVNLATARHVNVQVESDRYDYGYQIWVDKYRNSFLFNGMLGQNLIGYKDNGIVVLANAGNSEMFQRGNFFEYLNNAFSREFPQKLPASASGYKKLQVLISSLSWYNVTTKVGIRSKLKRFFVRPTTTLGHFKYLDKNDYKVDSGDSKAVGILPLVIQSVENCYSKGFLGAGFATNDNGVPTMVYKEQETEYTIPLGFSHPEIFSLKYRNDSFLIASSAKFTSTEDDEEVLVVRLDFLETPSTKIIKIYFVDDDTLKIEQSEMPGAEFMVNLTEMFMAEYTDKPIIGAMLDKFGADYIEYRIEKIFNSKLTLKKIITK